MEKSFNEMVKDKGVKQKIIKGKDQIGEFFDAQPYAKNSIEWSPDYIEVAASGDLAYTYGKYKFLCPRYGRQ